MKCSIASGSISSHKACVLFSNSAVKVHRHDSQAYRNMEMTRERISFTFDPRDMLLSLQMCFSFVRAAVACAILERISGLRQSSETTAPRYLKLVTVPSFCPFTFISLWMPLFVISLVFSALIFFILYLVKVLSRLSTRASSSCSSSARASISSANRRLVIFLPPMLTFPSCSSRASDMIRSRKNVEEGG